MNSNHQDPSPGSSQTPGSSQKSSLKKQLILDAATCVIEQEGTGHLTIDAVATMAGISKGGVLYHYPNKQTLLRGMLDRVIESQKARIAENRQTRGGTHAHVLSVVQPLPKSESTMSLAILAAAAEDPDLLDNARAFMRQVMDAQHEGSEGSAFNDAFILILAAEGLRIMEALNLVPATDSERQGLTQRLLERAQALSPHEKPGPKVL